MFGRQDELDRRIVANLWLEVARQGDAHQTEGSRIPLVGRPVQLERRHEHVAIVLRHATQTNVHVDERRRVSGKPRRLERQCTAAQRPLGAVVRNRHSATGVHPLHAVRV